jgi:hypothetical protein
MIAYRLREWGSAEWTEILLEGELEEFAGEMLVAAMSPYEGHHLQQRVDGEWTDL